MYENSMHERYSIIVDQVYHFWRHKFTSTNVADRIRLSLNYESRELKEHVEFVSPTTIQNSLRNMVIALGSLGYRANEVTEIMKKNLHVYKYQDREAMLRRDQELRLRQQMMSAKPVVRSRNHMDFVYSSDSKPLDPKLKRYDPDQYESLIGQYYVDKDGKLFHRELDRDYMVPMKWNDMSKSMYDYDSEEVVEETPKPRWTDSIAVFQIIRALRITWRDTPSQHKDVLLGAALFLFTLCLMLYLRNG